ncbi:MAG: alpha/beta hydrolase [Pseudomonadota bacterium]
MTATGAPAAETPPPLHQTDAVSPPPGGETFWMRAADGVRLRGAHWPPAEAAPRRGAALLFQGRTEFIEKFYEPIARLQALGLSVTTLDWRGQGLSDRPLGDRRRGHVADFAAYQSDVDVVLAPFAERGASGARVLIAHSMGGAIAARALMRQQAGALRLEPGFAAAILSAPMLGLHGAAGGGVAGAAAATLSGIGWAEAYAPGGSPAPLSESGFEDNPLTSDRDRFERVYAAMIRAHPELALGGATWGWLRAARREMPQLRPTATPVLVAIGDAEAVVSQSAAARYAEGAPEGALLRLAGGARHEPFLETDALQERLWSAIAAFLDRWAPAA